MAGFDTSGFTLKTVEEILEEVNQAQLAEISEELDVGPASPHGQMNAAIVRQIELTWELSQEAAESATVRASGQALDDVCELSGTLRKPATFSEVTTTCTLTAAGSPYAAGTLIAHPTGAPGDRFANAAEVVVAVDGAVSVLMRAQTSGPVRANAGTLTVIAEPVTGWSAVTNATDAALGALRESDTALRARRETELAKRGNSTVDAIQVDVSNVSGVTFCEVLENDTDTTDGNGTPPHAIQCLVRGGTDAAVAAAIWAAKTAGIQAYGTTVETVLDSQGNSHAVGLTRPTEDTIYLDLAVTAPAATYVGDSSLKTSIAEWGNSVHNIGDDVIRARLIAKLIELGCTDVTLAEIGVTNGGEVSSNRTTAATHIARFDTSRIDLTSTLE